MQNFISQTVITVITQNLEQTSTKIGLSRALTQMSVLVVTPVPFLPMEIALSWHSDARDQLDQPFLARNNSTNPRIRSTAASNSTNNHVVGNHLAKMLERIIIQKPTMTKAAVEKILKAFAEIFFESLVDIPDQRLSYQKASFILLAMLFGEASDQSMCRIVRQDRSVRGHVILFFQ